jgi:hypothetical protein
LLTLAVFFLDEFLERSGRDAEATPPLSPHRRSANKIGDVDEKLSSAVAKCAETGV